jgi:Trk K+ transport system NAD-binding subunit
MKFLTTLIAAMSAPSAEGSRRALLRLSAIIVVSVVVFSAGFHWIMQLEGREFSWLSSFYWTMVTMSTLGYGDIVFESDLGRMYSLVVLIAGAILILVLLPFTFIQLVYLPWQAATRRARAPRELPDSADHVILTGLDPMNEALIERLRAAGVPYVLLVDDADRGVDLHDAGYRIAVGAIDDPQTYRNIRADRAAMMFTSRSDPANTNAAFTMREVTDRGLVVATANSADAVDILELAGCDRVLQLGELLGRALARRILAPTARSSVISTFEDLVIAETSAAGTPLVGCSLADLDLRERFGVSVVALWDRGWLQMATPDLVIEETSIVLLVGTEGQLLAYDDAFAPARGTPGGDGDGAHVVIIGGGRVGRATAAALREAGTPFRIVERLPERVRDPDDYVVGDAADIEVLRAAGIEEASAVAVTTHDDDMNLWLTLYCRRLRPHVEILGRVNLDRNLTTMHRAGADFVLSYASLGAMEAWNALRPDSTVLLAEGLVVFRVPVPASLAGRTLRDADLPATTGCTLIGIVRSDGCATEIGPETRLPADADLVLMGDGAAEARFLAHANPGNGRSLRGRLLGGRRRRS